MRKQSFKLIFNADHLKLNWISNVFSIISSLLCYHVHDVGVWWVWCWRFSWKYMKWGRWDEFPLFNISFSVRGLALTSTSDLKSNRNHSLKEKIELIFFFLRFFYRMLLFSTFVLLLQPFNQWNWHALHSWINHANKEKFCSSSLRPSAKTECLDFLIVT